MPVTIFPICLHLLLVDLTRYMCLGSIHYLGQPIKDTGFDLGDEQHNFCDGKNAQFEVSVKGLFARQFNFSFRRTLRTTCLHTTGPKDKGTMYFWAERDESEEWNVNRLELELKSIPDKRLIVLKPS